jgi:hypothetical protein
LLRRAIEAVDVRLRFLSVAGYDERRIDGFRQELLARRERAEGLLASLDNGPSRRRSRRTPTSE